MNIAQLAKSVGRQLRLRPLPHRRERDGTYLHEIDDLWSLQVLLAGPDRLRLVNIRTGHVVELQPDNVREYRSPDFLILRCQLTLTDHEVLIEPLVPATLLPGVGPDDWARIRGLMPALLAEMRSDLAAHPNRREVVLLKRSWSYWGKGNEFAYYFDDYPELDAHFQVLTNLDLVAQVPGGNVTCYRISESLARRLGG
jgi:hypothetical protein